MLSRLVVCMVALELATSTTVSRCRLARDLREMGIRASLIPDWVCLAEAESGRNSTAKKGPFVGGYYKFGIFQIPSNNWCEIGRKGKRCNANCEDFLSDDFPENINCATEIFGNHGFHHWEGWLSKCQGKPLPDILPCFRN